MKIPFSIEYRPQIESGEYKVIYLSYGTEEEFPARIICWDRHNKHPIVALIPNSGGYERVAVFQEEGIDNSNPHQGTLLIVTPEEEMSEFEKAIKRAYICGGWDPVSNDIIKDTAAELLALARKQLIEEQYTSDPRKTDLYKLGKAEALKDLPRWGLSTGHFDEGWLNAGILYYKLHAIPLKTLEKLPGFKED